MKRFLLRFVDKLYGINRIIFLVVLLLICTVSICVAVYIQFFDKYSETDPLMLGINVGVQKTDEEYEELKAGFNSLFTNTLTSSNENVPVVKMQIMKDVVYTNYEIKNEEAGRYNIDAKIPTINIDNEVAKEINQQIKNDFYDKISSIMNNTKSNSVYTVNYAAYINNEIVSVVIKANIKEGDTSERIIIKTYNYDIINKKKVSLDDLIALKGENKNNIQKKVRDDIKLAFNKVKDLQGLGYQMYQRDFNSNMYELDNTDVYFLTSDGYVYIIYSYGNQAYTNEVDIIIF